MLYSEDKTYAGVYDLEISVYYEEFSSNTVAEVFSFSVEIIDPCAQD